MHAMIAVTGWNKGLEHKTVVTDVVSKFAEIQPPFLHYCKLAENHAVHDIVREAYHRAD